PPEYRGEGAGGRSYHRASTDAAKLYSARLMLHDAPHMPSILIANGSVLDPSRVFERRLDVLLRDGKVEAVGHELEKQHGTVDRVMDATGCYVTPGLIDIHVHFREPGDEEEETIATGAMAAVAGGYTTICCMPNTNPTLDTAEHIEWVYAAARRAARARVLPLGTVTRGELGRELSDLDEMSGAGAVGFSDDGKPVWDSR